MPRLAMISLLLLWSPALATAEVVSLSQLESLALRDRPALAADAARTRAASAEIQRAKSGYHPSLSLEAQSTLAPGRKLVRIEDVSGDEYLVQGSRALEDGSVAFVPQFRNELGLELRGTLYDFGRTSAAVDAGHARHDATLASAEVTRTLILRSVRSAYLAWLGASELHAIAAQAAKDAENRRTRVEALIAEGVKPQAELTPARADELLIKLELERSGGELRVSKLALEQAVGTQLSASAEPDLTLLTAPAKSASQNEDPTLRALRGQREAASKTAVMQDKADAPVLAAAVSAGVYAHAETPFPAYAVGLSFSVPLWDGGVANASAAVARARADELSALLAEEQERLRSEQARARLNADNANMRLDSAHALLEVCSQRLTEAEQSYELGAGTLDQLAQARNLLRRAKTEVVLAKLARAEAVWSR